MESARHLLAHDPPILETACFHAQQAIEKTSKAILMMNDQRPPRTRNLSDLFGLCERWMPGISAHEKAAAWLSTCAVELRYPDNPPMLTLQTVRESLEVAQAIFDFVVSKVPPEVHP